MPVNKNAMTRYKFLDDLLSNRYHNYSLDDLTEEVNNGLCEIGINPISRRCIEYDIKYLESEGPFLAEIERYSVPWYDKEKQKSFNKRCLRYAQASFSIFKKEMTDDESYILSEALSLLGQFDGLPNLEGLEGLHHKLKLKQERQIISFTKNPLEYSTLLGELFTTISQHQVIELHYHTFARKEEKLIINLYPYLLKEYNRRWFLFAALEENGKILCFGLDRIDKVIPKPSHKYIEYDGNINELFDDIIGVTLYLDKPIEHILFWVSDSVKDYVETKPLHDSQKCYRSNKGLYFKNKYPKLSEGAYFSIDCIDNYELIRDLCSFGSDLVVLSPINIQNEVYERISKMTELYHKLRD